MDGLAVVEEKTRNFATDGATRDMTATYLPRRITPISMNFKKRG
jgi:hypothetical protein